MTRAQAINTTLRGPQIADTGGQLFIRNADGSRTVLQKQIPPAQQPQNIQTREIAKVKGKDTGQRQVQAPDIIANTTGALNIIESMFDHPGKNVIGSRVRQMINDPEGGMFVNPNPTDQKDFMIMHKFVMSQNFVNAVQQMRGLGQLSDREGAALAKSRNALSIASKPETYFKNLREIQQTLKTAQQRARDALNRAKPPGEAQLLSGTPTGNDSKSVDALLNQYRTK